MRDSTRGVFYFGLGCLLVVGTLMYVVSHNAPLADLNGIVVLFSAVTIMYGAKYIGMGAGLLWDVIV